MTAFDRHISPEAKTRDARTIVERGEAEAGRGVYLHWPYCERVCPYCDFNVFKDRAVDAEAWINALTGDLRGWRERVGPGALTSLYFGGGTPSLAPTPVIAAVIEACADLFGFEDDPEITLEANPTSAEAARFGDFQRAGVNRLSLGVQSLRDDALKFLGRDHSAADARKAFELARTHFPESSFDLIYARPEQPLSDWETELHEALALEPAHLSLYQLTIEPGTAFERATARGAWTPKTGDATADFYDLTQTLTADAGMPAYEISNHARADARSKHNMLYWRHGDYFGVGPGAHGRYNSAGQRYATETPRKPDAYFAHVAAHGWGQSAHDPLNEEDRLTERLALGLRLVDGCVLDQRSLTALGKRYGNITALCDDGLLSVVGDRLAATDDGRRVLNALLAAILNA
ncbi:MAG: radical SAM family heme chaperone HemW [Pseudomonadota bacterium]